MPRKRERRRFERTDVPRDNPNRNRIAVAVIVCVFAGLAVLVAVLWNRASESTHVGNDDLGAAVESQADATSPDGYALSDDDWTIVLVLTVDDLDSDAPELTAVHIMCLDATAGSGSLVGIPLDTKVSDGTSDTTLASLYETSGASACVSPLASATNLRMTHVVLADETAWEKLESLSGAGVNSLVSDASDLLSSLDTDMDAGELTDLAELVQSIGIDNLDAFDAEVTTEDDGNGGTCSVIDATNLGVAIGTLVPA